MWFSRLLCTFSGDDFSIIRQCDGRIRFHFMVIGACVVLIGAGCFWSSYVAFTMLFEYAAVAIPMAIFFTYMITNIYVLILYTLTKNSFPHIRYPVAKGLSIGIRVGFLAFIALIVAKPIETVVFSEYLKPELVAYKAAQTIRFEQSANQYFDNATKTLREQMEREQQLYATVDTQRMAVYQRLLAQKATEKDESIAKMRQLVAQSNYFIQGIIILSTKHKICWTVTLMVIFIFFIPAYLKNILQEQSVFYEKRRTIEIRLVKEEYAAFKIKYNNTLQTLWGENTAYSEPYSDAPFNTIRKADDRTFLTEDDLIADLYAEPKDA